MTIVPAHPQPVATPSPTSLTVDRAAALLDLDPWERARQAHVLVELLQRLSGVVLDLRRQAIRELVDKHQAPKAQVARHIGVTPTRVGQLVGTRATAEGVAA